MKSVQIRSFFWSVYFRIRTEYGELQSISPYSFQIWGNRDQKKLRIWTLFTQCSNIRDIGMDSTGKRNFYNFFSSISDTSRREGFRKFLNSSPCRVYFNNNKYNEDGNALQVWKAFFICSQLAKLYCCLVSLSFRRLTGSVFVKKFWNNPVFTMQQPFLFFMDSCLHFGISASSYHDVISKLL